MKRLLALLAAVLLAASSCSERGTPAGPAALTLEGHTVTIATVEDQLDAMAADPAIGQFLFGASLDIEGQAPGSYDPIAASALLSLYAQGFLLEDIAGAHGIEVTEAELAAAEEQIRQSVAQVDPSTGRPAADAGVLETLPDELLDTIVRLVANQEAILADLAEQADVPEISEEELRAAYDEVVPSATEACVSHILVAFTEDTDLLRDPTFVPDDEMVAAAQVGIDDAVARLEAGEDFAEVAQEVSDDTASGAQGGDLDCSSPTGYVGPFADAVLDQPVGEVGAVIETQFGFHVVLVRERTAPSFEELEPELRAQMVEAASDPTQAFSELLTERAEQVDVYVDGRFGEWEAISISVVPPLGAADPPTMGGDELDLPGLGL